MTTALPARVLLEDRTAAHQKTITVLGNGHTAVSCTCLKPRPGRPRVIIAEAKVLTGAHAAWLAWHVANGIAR